MTKAEKEHQGEIIFPESKLVEGMPARCVDGRRAENSKKGPQMLGGSLHPVLLSVITRDLDFNETNAIAGFSALKEAGYPVGLHRGSNHKPEECKSDCGFADKIDRIFQTAIQKKGAILQQLHQVYAEFRDQIPFSEYEFNQLLLEGSYSVLERYNPDRIQFFGDTLITAVGQHPELNANIEQVEGVHQEKRASVNLRPNTTLDTNRLIDEFGTQAFNLDILEASKQAQALGVDEHFALGTSMIFYVATKMVLAEGPEKPAIPVTVHS